MANPEQHAASQAALEQHNPASAEELLSAWGDFPPDWRRRLTQRLAQATAGSASGGRGEDAPVRRAMDALLHQWAQALGSPDIDALRAAFLAIDGARRWPDQFLAPRPSPAFGDELRRTLPRALPAPAPLDMPEQPL